MLPGHNPPLRELWGGSQVGTEAETMEEWLWLACSVFHAQLGLLYSPPTDAATYGELGLPHPSSTKKLSHRHVWRPILSGQSRSWCSLFPGCFKLTVNTNPHRLHRWSDCGQVVGVTIHRGAVRNVLSLNWWGLAHGSKDGSRNRRRGVLRSRPSW